MRRYDEQVRPALRALGLTDDDTDLLPFVARKGWTALPSSWRPPDATTRWPAARITGHDGVEIGFGVDSACLGAALAAAVVDAVEHVGETGRGGRARERRIRSDRPALRHRRRCTYTF
jgi:hypothetical protein